MDKKHLKTVQKGFANYTGPIGIYEFVDGVSVEPISKHERDRISACITCVEIAENGKENVAGVAERLVSESAARAPAHQPLVRQSVEDKIAEERKLAEAVVGDTKPIYSEAQLDAVIDANGISGLRQVASIWNVKHRSIPALRQMILDAQDEYLAKHKSRVERGKQAVESAVRKAAGQDDTLRPDARRDAEPVAETADDASDVTTREDVKDAALSDAAASGDMSAAVSDEHGDAGNMDLDDIGPDSDEKAG